MHKSLELIDEEFLNDLKILLKNPKCGNIWVTTVEKFRFRSKALVNVLLTVNGANCWDYRLDTLQTSGYEVFEVLMKTVGKFS